MPLNCGKKSIKRKGAPSERRTQFSFYFIWKI